MVTCRRCGDAIRVREDQIHVAERDILYHLSCAPDDLLRDAVTEGNAVLARGIVYYVNKYLPDELRAEGWPRKVRKSLGEEELAIYADLFARMVKFYRSEREGRKKS